MSDSKRELERIGNEYRQKVPEKLRELVAAFDDIDTVFWSRESVAPLMRKLHSLRGGAGTFGLKSLGETVAKIEQDLALVVAKPNGPSQRSWRQMGDNLRKLATLDLNEPRPQSLEVTPIQTPPENAYRPLIDLIEDNHDEAAFIAEVLASAGFRVRHFSAGELYCASWASDGFAKPDAILMDMVLQSGELAGAETVNAIKPDQFSSPVVFLSQRDDMQARLTAFRAGATRYLAKPVDPGHLVNLLDALTGRQPEDPYRVLLVDDEPKVLEVQAESLRMVGMSVRALSDPMETFNELEMFRPDVLLLDVYMPEVTGPEIAAIIRDSDDYLNLPILFLSAEQNISQQLMALNLGGDDFLLKPVRQDHLVAMVGARARRARQNAVMLSRMTALANQLYQVNKTFDEHCVRVALNGQFQVVDVNRHFERLTRRERRDVELKTLEELDFTPHQWRGFDEILQAASDQERWQGRLVLNTADGRIELETTIHALASPDAREDAQYWLIGTVLGVKT